MTLTPDRTYLFSIDLEDVRDWMPDGQRYAERVPAMTARYLEFLRQHAARCTFFVVGDVARKYPELIRTIAAEGHEIGCHSNKHITLENLDEKTFRADLEENILHLKNAGANEIHGFRAPILSLTERTQWVYRILKEMGFSYSSSVLPAKNPLYGWPEFGSKPKVMNGVLELPMTLLPNAFYPIPFAGGTYFRVLPARYILYVFEKFAKSHTPVLGYFHPYDIDTKQERFMHPGVHRNKFYNALMYYNRHSVFPKLEAVLQRGWKIGPYREYVQSIHH